MRKLFSSSKPELHQRERAPSFITVSYDRLRLILADFDVRTHRANRWSTYGGAALGLWAALITGDYTFEEQKYFLSGSQWQVVFLVAAIYASGRSLVGLIPYISRPRQEDVLAAILESADIARESRAMALFKFRGKGHDYRILVYRDPLWNCYLLPHANCSDLTPVEINDPHLQAAFGGFIGCSHDLLSLNYHAEQDLRTRKLSEFYRQDTLYDFRFYAAVFRDQNQVPVHMSKHTFTWNGIDFAWLTLSEMEADENTRRRNLDVTRHIRDHWSQLLEGVPDSVSAEWVKRSGM